MAVYHLSTPLKEENMRKLNVGDIVYLSGNIFTAIADWFGDLLEYIGF